ncbi:MAG: hypothetical protein J5965_26970 [Aeriscardovia sp.]|nr:hypothetical protein [Aeriscardovia sp.]
MIYDKIWLKETIEKETSLKFAPRSRFLTMLLLRLKGNERWPINDFLISLRYFEYWEYKRLTNSLSVLGQLHHIYWHCKFRRNQIKNNLFIEPFTIQGGANLVHPGYRKIPEFVKIGTNCTILPMVLLGKKVPGINGDIKVGDGCYISTGVTILGPVIIGDNVIIT